MTWACPVRGCVRCWWYVQCGSVGCFTVTARNSSSCCELTPLAQYTSVLAI